MFKWFIHRRSNQFIYTHRHTHKYTHTFASIVITTPQGSNTLCFVYENNELLINAKSPIFQCVKIVRIPNFSGRYFTALSRSEYGDLSNTHTFCQLFLELQNYRLLPPAIWLLKVYNGNKNNARNLSKVNNKNTRTPE